jgi:hypothetical protein
MPSQTAFSGFTARRNRRSNTTSNLTAILLPLATLLWATFCVYFALREVHRRCDDIATGVVNGHRVSSRYRWLMLYQDYVGSTSGVVLVLLALAAGYYMASGVVSDPSVKLVAQVCAGVAAWSALAILPFAIAWVVHLGSVLREAGID